MGRYIGLWTNKGKGGGGGLGPVKPFTRSSGIATDSSNHVTEVTLDDVKYTQMFYNNVGLVTGYNEDFGGNKKGWLITYTSQNLVDTVVERIPAHPDPAYNITPSSFTIDENSTITFNISTVDVPDATFYWKADGTNVTTADFTGGAITGSVTTSGGSAQVSLTTSEDLATEGNETFQFKLYADAGYTQLLGTSATVTISDSSISDVNYATWYTPGTYSWTVPAGVTKARVVVIGGGGGGAANGSGAGGGAAMKYWSNMVPGTTHSLTVGQGGARINSSNGNNGSSSEFQGPTTISATGGYGYGNGGNAGGQGSNGDVNGTGGVGNPYSNDPVSAYGYTTHPQGAGTNGGAGGGGGGADNGNAINGGAGSYYAGGGGGGGSDNGQGGDGGQGGSLVIDEFSGNARAFGGGGGGTDGTNAGVFGGPGGSVGGVVGQGYGDGTSDNDGGDGGGPIASRGEKGEGVGQNAGGGGGGAFGGGGGGAGHQEQNNCGGAGGGGLVYIVYGGNVPTGY